MKILPTIQAAESSSVAMVWWNPLTGLTDSKFESRSALDKPDGNEPYTPFVSCHMQQWHERASGPLQLEARTAI